MKLHPRTLAAIATWNSDNARARRAYAADTFAHLTPRQTCACGAYTRRPNGVCRDCQETR